MLFKMADEKTTTAAAEPTVVFATAQKEDPCKRSRVTRKHVLIAVITLLVTGLVVTGALVGMKIYTDSNLDVLKYALQANGVSQNVSVQGDVVTYHVLKDGLEAWIVQNFDTGLQVTKQVTDGSAACYVTALNRSQATVASAIPDTTPDTTGASSGSVFYKVLPDPVTDLTFLGQKASSLCQNIPTYQAVPDCGAQQSSDASSLSNSTSPAGRKKRTPAICNTCNAPSCVCICGCCGIVCATWPLTGTVCAWSGLGSQWTCHFFYTTLYAVYTMPYPTCTYNGRYYMP